MRTTRTGITLMLLVFTNWSSIVLADPPGPPGPGGDPVNGHSAPVGAPIDNGTLFLLGIAAIYLSWKLVAFYRAKRKEALQA